MLACTSFAIGSFIPPPGWTGCLVAERGRCFVGDLWCEGGSFQGVLPWYPMRCSDWVVLRCFKQLFIFIYFPSLWILQWYTHYFLVFSWKVLGLEIGKSFFELCESLCSGSSGPSSFCGEIAIKTLLNFAAQKKKQPARNYILFVPILLSICCDLFQSVFDFLLFYVLFF